MRRSAWSPTRRYVAANQRPGDKRLRLGPGVPIPAVSAIPLLSMKNIPLLAAVCGLLSLIAPAQSLAAAAGPKARIFAEFDTNKNGIIDGDEVAAVRKAYAADPKGQFAVYDVDHDGKLSDAEIANIKPPGAKKAGDKKAGGKKKAADDTPAPAPDTPKPDTK